MKTTPQYKRTEFKGYTHRFKVEFDTGEEYTSSLDIYTDSEEESDLIKFIEENKTRRVKAFRIIHVATKMQDDLASELIECTIKNL